MARWEMLTSKELAGVIQGGNDFAILPIGATEQHGSHLATGTDTISANLIAQAAGDETGVLVLPAIPYGCSLGHTDLWPGTISLSPATLTELVLEIARWAIRSGVRRLMFFSGHATNAPSIGSAILQLRHDYPSIRFRQIGIWEISPEVHEVYTQDGVDIHANRAETSLLSHLAPEAVHMNLATDEADVTPGLIWSYDMPRTTRTGVVGRPSEATKQEGASMYALLVRDFSQLIRAAIVEEWPIPPTSSGLRRQV